MTITRLRLRVPDLRVQADAMQIRQILQGAPGIDRVDADYEAGIVDLITAAQDGGANCIEKLTRAGFPPSEIQRIEAPQQGR